MYSKYCYARRFQDTTPIQAFTTLLQNASSGQAYLEYQIPSIPNGLFKSATCILNISNSNTTTAANLFSGGNFFNSIQLLKGGSQVLQTFQYATPNNIEECLKFKNPYESYWAMATEGYASATLYSGTTIPASGSLTLYCPLNFSLTNTLIPFDSIGKGNYTLRLYFQPSVLYAATGNVTLSNLTINTANLRFEYIEIDNHEYQTLIANNRFLNFKSLIRRVQSWPITSMASGQEYTFVINGVYGVFSQCVVWYSSGTTNTNIDVFTNIFQTLYIINAGQQNVLGQINWNPQDLRFWGSKAYGSNYFLENINTGVFALTNFSSDDCLENLKNNGHSSGYLLAPDNPHSLVVFPNQSVTGGQLNILFWFHGIINLDTVTGGMTEEG